MVCRKHELRYMVRLDLAELEKKHFDCLVMNGFHPSRAESYIEWRRKGLEGASPNEISFFMAVEQDLSWRLKQMGWA